MQWGARGQGAFWLEARPWEGGRSVIVRGDTGEDLTPAGMNVRTRVHEYGGGAWEVLPTLGLVVFSDFASQRLFAQPLDGSAAPQPLTPDVEGAQLRFADFCLDEARGRLVCVMEDHRGGGKEPTNCLVGVPLPEVGSGGGKVGLRRSSHRFSHRALTFTLARHSTQRVPGWLT